MAIYDHKKFLNIDDVAEYLTDKGVSAFYPLTTYTEKRFNDLLSEWIKSERLRPLYSFNKWVMQYKIDYGFEINENNAMEFAQNTIDDFKRVQNGEPKQHNYKEERIDVGEKYINDYLIFGNGIWDSLCVFESVPLTFLDWYRFYNDENNQYQFDIIYCDDVPEEYREFTIYRNKVLFLKSELDAIFNPNQDPTSQAHARIAELEQQLANAPNQATRSQKDEHISEFESQTSENRLMLKGLALHNHNIAKAKAFAQIIAKSIWDMDENQQIKTGDMVQYIKGLLLKFDQKNLPQNDETLADWLKDVKPTYATKGGRPPKDAPNKITLTFKK